MMQEYPKFYDSPYFVDEPGNWHIKPGAPKEVVEEFEAFQKAQKSMEPVRKYDHIEEI